MFMIKLFVPVYTNVSYIETNNHRHKFIVTYHNYNELVVKQTHSLLVLFMS